MRREAGGQLKEDAGADRKGGEEGRTDHLHAGAFSLAVFLPERRSRKFQTSRTYPGAELACISENREEIRGSDHRFAF